MPESYIIDAVRTPVGKRGGALAGVHSADLAAHSIAALVRRTGIDAGAVDDVVLGCCDTIGSQAGDVARTEALVRQPGSLGDALLPYLLRPANVGCGHLKLILLHPEAYGVRKGLTERFLETVFRAIWSGADINYVVLQGGHAEGAVVQITAGKSKHAYTRVPMVAPCVDGQQMFVNHPKVVGWMRAQMAHFLVDEEPLLRDVDPHAFAEAVNALAGVQLGETLGHLAKGLPVYQARVTEAGVVQITK